MHDLAVIGGGLAGTATAYFAARRGARVVLLEKRDLNLAASGSNAGSIHAQIPFAPFRDFGIGWARRYAAMVPLLRAAIRRWQALEAELGGATGVSVCGGLMVAANAADMRLLERKAEIERAVGLPVELWDRGELAARAPFLAGDLVGAAFCPEEGKADPFLATPLFARRAAALGAEIRREAEVRAIVSERSGFRLSAVTGELQARRVVNAAGAEAAVVARMVGLTLALESHPIQIAVTEKRPEILPWLVYFTGALLTLKQSAEGGFLIGGGWPSRLRGTPQVDPHSMIRNLAVARRVMPGLRGVDVVRSWAALVNGTSDWAPILGEAPGVPGFFLNLFPWTGFTAAPAVSEAIADLALGLLPGFDLNGYLPR